MSKIDDLTGEAKEMWDRAVAEFLADDPPPKKAEATVVELQPWSKQPWRPEPSSFQEAWRKQNRVWSVEADKVTSYQAQKVTYADKLVELRQEVAEAARKARWRSDPLGIWEDNESIDDVVRRQDETR